MEEFLLRNGLSHPSVGERDRLLTFLRYDPHFADPRWVAIFLQNVRVLTRPYWHATKYGQREWHFEGIDEIPKGYEIPGPYFKIKTTFTERAKKMCEIRDYIGHQFNLQYVKISAQVLLTTVCWPRCS